MILFTPNKVTAQATTSILEGKVIDKSTGEPIIGATIFFPDIRKGSMTDQDGLYSITNLPIGVHRAEISGISYKKISVNDLEIKEGANSFDIVLEESANLLDEIVVTSVKRMNSEIAMVQATRSAGVVMSGMSGKQISKSQDRNAAEVVRRIPGVSIMNDRYIIVRGLPSRYNNVWVNNSSVPSTEADSRSFSFDILPSSQLESIMIVKSQSAEIPSDFSGGFVKITTGSMPEVSESTISYGMGMNSVAHFNDQYRTKGYLTELFGIGGSQRRLSGIVPQRVDNNNSSLVTEVTKSGFSQEWEVLKGKALPDQRVTMMFGRAYNLNKGYKMGIAGALNYTRSSQTYKDMTNARFGVFNINTDEPEYIYKYTDNQYSLDSRIGGMLNITLMSGKNKIEFRNMINIMGKNRYTSREGWQNVSAKYIQEKKEYLYTNRTIYTGQLAGSHRFSKRILDWNIAYSFAGMDQPDRRIINREENNIYGDQDFGKMSIDQNEITRDFVNLKEHIITPALNYILPFEVSQNLVIELKAGVLGEYKTRNYKNRQFFYRFNRYSLPSNFVYRDVVDEILKDNNYGSDKLYLYEDTDNRNSYKGEILNGAGYFSAKMTSGRFNIIAGVRAETGKMRLTNYDKIYEFTTVSKDYDYFDIYPSLNASYNISKNELIRVAYGKSVNRQEFRELSSSVYYDFNLFSDVKGNPELKHATINNIDIRYEYYPTNNEYITLALFYKHFKNPIEWTYLDAGGSYTYTFENAKAANNMGVEADIRKNLKFVGLKNLTLGLNAAYIYSRVEFDKENSLERDRAMQGQSPYIINTSLFYDSEKLGLSAGILYNRIGKRIVGIGKADTGTGASVNNEIPDTYELSKDVIDITLSKKIGKRVELKGGVKDILNQSVIFQQDPQYLDSSGNLQQRNQNSKTFKPGSYYTLAIQIKL
ncbi:MAG: outer membrane beta-barrel protein [Bacteroidales bacterium]|nr:outer membrane beta-barrel protein [Bacteroidales bacterium]